MRLLHFSDLHLGVETYGTLDPATGLSSRVLDFLCALDAIVERAIAERVDAVLFAGDAFKNRDPSPTIQREFARRIGRLAAADIPIVLLVGNHDLPNVALRAAPTEIYQILNVPGVYVCRDIDLLTIPTRSGPLQVLALPWVTRSLFLASDGFRELAEIDLDRAIAQAVSTSVEELAARLDPALPAVLLGHLSLQGASLGFEQSIMLGRDVTVGRDELHVNAFDYVALGHIHKHQVVGTNPPAVYAGSPERIDFGEEREDKGYVLLSIEEQAGGGRASDWKFVELAARPFRTLRLEALGDDPMPAVERDLNNAAREVRGAIVRCFVRVDPGRERSVAPADVRRLLLGLGAAYVAHVVVESEMVARARVSVTAESMQDSVKMLEQWLETRDTDPALRERVLAKGRELIERRRQRIEGENDEHG